MKMKTPLLIASLALAGVTQVQAGTIKKVFVIALENHNWTQLDPTASPKQLFQNPAAPFLNSLVDGTSGISEQVAYAEAYYNAPDSHPSEPNYIWAEAGTDFGVDNDHDPYDGDCNPVNVQEDKPHLSAFLMDAAKSWKSYQEDTDINFGTNMPLPMDDWTVPLFSNGGHFTDGVNAYNYTDQYNYAAKHNPMVFFTDTNGGCDTSTANPLRFQYAPLQQLMLDLADNTVADYNWITPDQYNEMHSKLETGYGQYSADSDESRVAAGDNFLARMVPLIMASEAYKDHGMIVLWWDEAEGVDRGGDQGPDAPTMPFVIISKDVHENADGVPYSNTITYTHSSFLRTMQEIFKVDPPRYDWLGDATNATDLSDLMKPGSF